MCLVWLIKKSLKKVLNKDIYESLQQIDILKALGPYGFLAVFFQWYWHIVRDKVNEVVTSFFGHESLSLVSNYSYVCCSPKD